MIPTKYRPHFDHFTESNILEIYKEKITKVLKLKIGLLLIIITGKSQKLFFEICSITVVYYFNTTYTSIRF